MTHPHLSFPDKNKAIAIEKSEIVSHKEMKTVVRIDTVALVLTEIFFHRACNNVCTIPKSIRFHLSQPALVSVARNGSIFINEIDIVYFVKTHKTLQIRTKLIQLYYRG